MMKPVPWNLNTALVITFCLNTAYLLGSAAAIGSGWSMKYTDESFNSTLRIHNRTVHCLGKPQGSHYPIPMYTCQNISVDNIPLFHAPAKPKATRKPIKDSSCSHCDICGVETGLLNDVHALCKEMLSAMGVKESLDAAYVVNPTCMSHEEEPRVKFSINEQGAAEWHDLKRKNGYIRTLQCSTEQKSDEH